MLPFESLTRLLPLAMAPSPAFRVAVLVISAGVAWLVSAGLSRLCRALGLERTNYQGARTATGGGLLFVLGALCWYIGDWWYFGGGHGAGGRGVPLEPALAAVGFGLLGLLDDCRGTSEFKGLRGHLRALASGQVTTGLVKAVGGISLAGWLAREIRPDAQAILLAALIALAANLFNLLDLRPLRCLKAFWLLAAGLLPAGPLVLCSVYGLSLGYAPGEARRRVMLGDTGANALGGLVGCCAAMRLPWEGICAAVVLLLAAHVWTERNSFSAWIDRHPWARRIDRWGWAKTEP